MRVNPSQKLLTPFAVLVLPQSRKRLLRRSPTFLFFAVFVFGNRPARCLLAHVFENRWPGANSDPPPPAPFATSVPRQCHGTDGSRLVGCFP